MREDTFALIRLAQGGDRQAAERLAEENSGLIWSVARRFFGRGAEPDDLFQLGSLGFLKAVRDFDPGYGTRFSTYAVPKIAGEIRRFLRDDGTVKVSRGLKERASQIRSARGALEQRLGREPTISELGEALRLTPEEIAVAETATGAAESMQRVLGDADCTLEQLLGDDGQEERLVERFALDEAIGRLPERERMVIALRFFHGMTQDGTSRVLGISQVQVSRLERRALEQLREYMTAADG